MIPHGDLRALYMINHGMILNIYILYTCIIITNTRHVRNHLFIFLADIRLLENIKDLFS